MICSKKFYLFLTLVTLTSALSERVITKRVLPTNESCDPDLDTCRKGDLTARNIADCKYDGWLTCDAQNDSLTSWTVNLAEGDRCKPASGKQFKCGAPGTNTRCVCSDKKILINECRCQYWPPEDVGTTSPAFCNGYYTGGISGLHHWACCNNCNDPSFTDCDGTTWDGGSNEEYCSTCGQNTGGGRVKYYFNCGSCSTQQACSRRCSGNDFPGLCWRWLDCFKGCCLASATQPRQNKVQVSELSFCGDGTCSKSETPDSCPPDCCYQINGKACGSTSSNSSLCCGETGCCLNTTKTNRLGNSVRNKSASIGKPTCISCGCCWSLLLA